MGFLLELAPSPAYVGFLLEFAPSPSFYGISAGLDPRVCLSLSFYGIPAGVLSQPQFLWNSCWIEP